MSPAPGVHHIALGAVDVDAVAAFYRTVCGVEEQTRHHQPDGALRSVWLCIAPGAVLMVERVPHDAAARPLEPTGVVARGPFLLAFQALAGERRADVERRLGLAGVAIDAVTEHSVYFRDPEGHRVAISAWPLP